MTINTNSYIFTCNTLHCQSSFPLQHAELLLNLIYWDSVWSINTCHLIPSNIYQKGLSVYLSFSLSLSSLSIKWCTFSNVYTYIPNQWCYKISISKELPGYINPLCLCKWIIIPQTIQINLHHNWRFMKALCIKQCSSFSDQCYTSDNMTCHLLLQIEEEDHPNLILSSLG